MKDTVKVIKKNEIAILPLDYKFKLSTYESGVWSQREKIWAFTQSNQQGIPTWE